MLLLPSLKFPISNYVNASNETNMKCIQLRKTLIPDLAKGVTTIFRQSWGDIPFL